MRLPVKLVLSSPEAPVSRQVSGHVDDWRLDNSTGSQLLWKKVKGSLISLNHKCRLSSSEINRGKMNTMSKRKITQIVQNINKRWTPSYSGIVHGWKWFLSETFIISIFRIVKNSCNSFSHLAISADVVNGTHRQDSSVADIKRRFWSFSGGQSCAHLSFDHRPGEVGWEEPRVSFVKLSLTFRSYFMWTRWTRQVYLQNDESNIPTSPNIPFTSFISCILLNG